MYFSTVVISKTNGKKEVKNMLKYVQKWFSLTRSNNSVWF